MCFCQLIHTARHADLLAFNAGAQHRHVCGYFYPAPATSVEAAELQDEEKGKRGLGEERKCPLHSCCRISRELIFECMIVKNGGTCHGGGGGGGGGGSNGNDNALGNGNGGVNGEGEGEDRHSGYGYEYEEIVYVPFKSGEEPVWEVVVPEVKEEGTAAAPGWEILWDADAEGYCSYEDDDRGDGDDFEESESVCAENEAEDEDQDQGWEIENEGEIPYMEFWSFDPSPSPSPSLSYPYSISSVSDNVDGTVAAATLVEEASPTGKIFIFFEEDPVDLLRPWSSTAGISSTSKNVAAGTGDANIVADANTGGNRHKRGQEPRQYWQRWFNVWGRDRSKGDDRAS